MNIVVLASGGGVEKNTRFPPNLLLEINGKLLLEHFLDKLEFKNDFNLIFVIDYDDVKNHRLDKVISLSAPHSQISVANSPTKGALCSFMLTVDDLDFDKELLILNSNEILNIKYQDPLDQFYVNNADAGAVIFNSVKPIYSYVNIDDKKFVTFASEKNPISKNATAGFYWYKETSEFLVCAEDTILKNDSHNDLFYICPAFNQMILRKKSIFTYKIDEESYIPIKSSLQKERLVLQNQLNFDHENS